MGPPTSSVHVAQRSVCSVLFQPAAGLVTVPVRVALHMWHMLTLVAYGLCAFAFVWLRCIGYQRCCVVVFVFVVVVC